MTAPGWYTVPGGQHRYWDGHGWIVAQPTPGLSSKQKWWLIGGCAAVAIMFCVLAGLQIYLDSRPVRNAHSDNPGIEAFYRELDSLGMGNMRVKDATDRGEEVCRNGNGLVLWGEGDFSMADSFRFATAAVRSCDALEG